MTLEEISANSLRTLLRSLVSLRGGQMPLVGDAPVAVEFEQSIASFLSSVILDHVLHREMDRPDAILRQICELIFSNSFEAQPWWSDLPDLPARVTTGARLKMMSILWHNDHFHGHFIRNLHSIFERESTNGQHPPDSPSAALLVEFFHKDICERPDEHQIGIRLPDKGIPATWTPEILQGIARAQFHLLNVVDWISTPAAAGGHEAKDAAAPQTHVNPQFSLQQIKPWMLQSPWGVPLHTFSSKHCSNGWACSE
eukprot:GABV01008710.1.p1 GENE.GABV01008710.1~~GABV01008710.1.p1  ORF type:complete len:255 (-),score=87.42 GABV01008710.1:132-896(-)